MSKKFSEAGFPAPNQYDDWRSWAASFLVALDSLSNEEVHNFPLYRRDLGKVREGLPVGVDGDMIRVLDEDSQQRLYVFENGSWERAQEDIPEQEDILRNLDYVVEWKSATADDPTWFRVYKSGWVEQGGHYTHNNQEGTVTTTFIKSFSNTNYNLQITKELGSASASNTDYQFISAYVASSKTTSQFQVRMTAANRLNGYDWQACGQGATNGDS